LKKVANNVTWLMSQRVVELAIRFFVGAWLVRYLGPHQFGVYSYAISFVALFSDLAAMGLDKIVVRDLARGVSASGDVIIAAMALRTVAAIVTAALIVLAATLVESDPQVRSAVWILSLQLLFNPAMVFELWFQSQVSARYVVWIRTLVTLLVAGAQIGFISAGYSLQAFLFLVVAQAMLTAAGLAACFWRLGPRLIGLRPSLRLALKMAREALPVLLAGMSVSIYMRIDQVMLGRMDGISAVGKYGAAAKVSEIWYFVPAVLAISVFPDIVRMSSGSDADAYNKKLQAIYDWVALYSYIVIAIMVAAAPLVISALFGSAFGDSVAVLRVHIFSLLFVSLGVVCTRWFVAEDLMTYAAMTTLLGAVVNVTLNLIWIPSFGAVGAAWATLVAYGVAALFSTFLFPRLWPASMHMTKALAAPLRVVSITRTAIRGIVG